MKEKVKKWMKDHNEFVGVLGLTALALCSVGVAGYSYGYRVGAKETADAGVTYTKQLFDTGVIRYINPITKKEMSWKEVCDFMVEYIPIAPKPAK